MTNTSDAAYNKDSADGLYTRHYIETRYITYNPDNTYGVVCARGYFQLFSFSSYIQAFTFIMKFSSANATGVTVKIFLVHVLYILYQQNMPQRTLTFNILECFNPYHGPLDLLLAIGMFTLNNMINLG